MIYDYNCRHRSEIRSKMWSLNVMFVIRCDSSMFSLYWFGYFSRRFPKKPDYLSNRPLYFIYLSTTRSILVRFSLLRNVTEAYYNVAYPIQVEGTGAIGLDLCLCRHITKKTNTTNIVLSKYTSTFPII